MGWPDAHTEKRIQEMYEAVPEWVRDDIAEASKWARDTLRDHEGAGHCFYITGDRSLPGAVVCSFAKPQWSGDHCGRPMEHGAEAMVMAVCEYLSGA